MYLLPLPSTTRILTNQHSCSPSTSLESQNVMDGHPEVLINHIHLDGDNFPLNFCKGVHANPIYGREDNVKIPPQFSLQIFISYTIFSQLRSCSWVTKSRALSFIKCIMNLCSCMIYLICKSKQYLLHCGSKNFSQEG